MNTVVNLRVAQMREIRLTEKLLASEGRLLDGVKTVKSATSLSPIGTCQLIGQ